jgi:hypothetical protein
VGKVVELLVSPKKVSIPVSTPTKRYFEVKTSSDNKTSEQIKAPNIFPVDGTRCHINCPRRGLIVLPIRPRYLGSICAEVLILTFFTSKALNNSAVKRLNYSIKD